MSSNDKIRKVDVEKLSSDRIDNLGVQIGDKLAKILQKASDDANRFLTVYGLEVKLTYKLAQKEATKENN